MADPVHLGWLSEGTEAWNERRKLSNFVPDLRRAKLQEASLRQTNLREADLSFAKLWFANLTEAKLYGAVLRMAEMQGANLQKSQLDKANCQSAILEFANLQQTVLRGVRLKGSRMGQADLRGAKFLGVDLQEANLYAADVSTLIVRLSPATNNDAVEYTDLSRAINLSQEQLDSMKGDSGTILPKGLTRPAHWPELEMPEPEGAAPKAESHAEPPFAFLSYASQDRELVMGLHHRLAGEGLTLWWDQDIASGGVWREEIARHLEDAAVVVTFWTAQSTVSAAVIEEAATAQRQGKLVHARLDAAPLPYGFGETQYTDLRGWDGSAAHPAFQALLAGIRAKLAEGHLQDAARTETGGAGNATAGLTLRAASPIDVFWEGGQLSAQFSLAAKEPAAQSYHPPQNLPAQIDLLASLGQLSRQIIDTLATDDRLNARAFCGDLSTLFRAINAEVNKDEGLVLSFVVDANLTAIEALMSKNAEVLRDVDGALVAAFVTTGQSWRKGSTVLREIEDPQNAEIIPEDRLEQIEAKEEEMIELLTSDEAKPHVSPSLVGVTRDMAAYPWDKDDPQRNRRMRAAAFAALADRILGAVRDMPSPLMQNIGIWATLSALALSIVTLVLGG